MAVTKVTAQGEQLVIDISQWNGVTGEIVHKDISEMSTMLNEVLKFSDIRIMEMNLRMLEAYELEKYFEPSTWARVVRILDVLAGRMSAESVARSFKAENEETKELERIRQEHYNTELSLTLDLEQDGA